VTSKVNAPGQAVTERVVLVLLCLAQFYHGHADYHLDGLG
jgi:hypothetical protein